jgi:hypothetical protein
MFDLEREIQRWRRELLASGLNSSELDELEDHLRTGIEEQLHSGVAVHEAFAIAVERIGRGSLLNAQFDSACAIGPANWRSGNTGAVVKGTIGLLAACAIVLAAVYYLSGVPIAFKTGASLLGAAFLAIVAGAVWMCGRGPRTTVSAEKGSEALIPPDVQELFSLARGEARRLGHDYVGTEHLLLALAIHDAGVLAKVLEKLGLGREALRKEIENRIKACVAHERRTRLPFTPRLNRALRLAANEADSCGQRLNADHFLLGLLRERTGVAGSVLRSLGFNVEQVRSSLA